MNSSPKLRKRADIAACTSASIFLFSHQLIQRYETIAQTIQDTVGYHPPHSPAALHPGHLLSWTTWFAHLAISSTEHFTILSITSPLP